MMKYTNELRKFEINNPRIPLENDEKCYYQGTASTFKIKNKVTGYSGGGLGVSYRLTKHIGLTAGGYNKTPIRENIKEKFIGTIYITNKRIIMFESNYGFDVKYEEISSFYNDGNVFSFFAKNKNYNFEIMDINFKIVLRLLGNSEQENKGIEVKDDELDAYFYKVELEKENAEIKKQNKEKKKWKNLSEKDKKKRVRIIILVIVVILLLALIGSLLP